MSALIESAVFYLIAGIVLLSALGVVMSKNMVHSAVFLVLSFLGVAACFFELQAGFLGMIQILVYGGAVSVLIIFAIMLVMNEKADTTNPMIDSRISQVISLGLGLAICAVLAYSVKSSTLVPSQAPPLADPIEALARLMLGDYVIAFELAAVLLLVAVTGAIILAKGEEEA